MRNIYAALDLGSSSIKLVLGEVDNGKVNVLEVKKIKSDGFRNGEILNQQIVAKAINDVVTDATKSLGVEIKSVLLSVPPKDLKVRKSEASIKIVNDHLEVTDMDINNVIEIAKKSIESPGFEIINTRATKYFLANGVVVTNPPIGARGHVLGVETFSYTVPSKLYNQYISTIRLANLGIINISLSSTAIANEAITDHELEVGAILIDLGHHTTSVTAYVGGKITAATVIGIGGKLITNDVLKILGVDIKRANTLKHKYAKLGSNDKQIIHVNTNGGKPVAFTVELLSKIIEARVAEIADEIANFMDSNNLSRNLRTILVGGTANLKGMDEFLNQYLGLSSKVYTPDTIGARDSALVPGLGMIYAE